MTTINHTQSSVASAASGARPASASMAAAWQLSPHQLDAARKVLQHVQRSLTAAPSAGAGAGAAQQ